MTEHLLGVLGILVGGTIVLVSDTLLPLMLGVAAYYLGSAQ